MVVPMDLGKEHRLLRRSLNRNIHYNAPHLIRGPGLQVNPFLEPWAPDQVRRVALLVRLSAGSGADFRQCIWPTP